MMKRMAMLVAMTFTPLMVAGGGGESFLFLTSAVPEPATWAMIIVGFALAGVAMRRRQRTTSRITFA